MLTRFSFLTTALASLIPSFMKPKTTKTESTETKTKIQWLKPTDRQEQSDIQIVACMMAAEGSREAHAIKKGHWAWTPALEAVTQLFADRQAASHEALGWMYEEACRLQNSGRYIGTVSVPEIIDKMHVDLGMETDLRFIRCPQCAKRLFTYRNGDEVTFKKGSFMRCVDCDWWMSINAPKEWNSHGQT